MSSIYIHIPDVFDLNLKRKIESAILTEIDLRHNELNEKLILTKKSKMVSTLWNNFRKGSHVNKHEKKLW